MSGCLKLVGGATRALSDQIADLKVLAPGWSHQPSESVVLALLDDFERFLEQAIAQTSIDLPHVYAAPDGGVRAEWSMSDWELSAEALPEQAIYLHATHLRSDRSMEANVEPGPRAAVAFADFVKELGDS